MKNLKDQKLIIGAGVFILALAVVLMLGSPNSAVEKVKSAYSKLGTDVEVLSAKEESGIYKLVLRPANSTTVQEVYVTKDGQLLLNGVQKLDDFTNRLIREAQ